MRLVRTLLLLSLVLLPASLLAQREKMPWEDLEIVEKKWPGTQRTFTGIHYKVLKEGSGDLVKSGDKVSVLYVGSLLDGTIFDQTKDAEHPFVFRVDRGQVIDGWEQGLQLMRLGEKRLLIVPSSLGYGVRGNPPSVPKNATLVFEVEVVKIEQ